MTEKMSKLAEALLATFSKTQLLELRDDAGTMATPEVQTLGSALNEALQWHEDRHVGRVLGLHS